MRRHLLLTVLLFLLAVQGVNAQDTASEKSWYWAWIPDTGEVVAYTIDGEIHVLTNSVTAILLRPLNHQIALAMLQIGDGYALYKMDAQSVTQISQNFTGSLEDDAGRGEFGVFEVHLPYAFMHPSIHEPGAIWIVNIEKNTVETLLWDLDSRNFRCFGGCMSWSQDGTQLRYAVNNPPENEGKEIGELRERNLATGEERVFYKILSHPAVENYSVSCESDTYGENWLCHAYDFSGKETLDHYWLVGINGTTQALLPGIKLDPAFWRIYLSGDEVVISTAGCEKDCSVMLRPIQTSDVLQIPLKVNVTFSNLIRVDSETFLVFPATAAGILNKNGKFEWLGEMFCCEYVNSQSQDGHWVVTLNPDEQKDQVWDVIQQKVVYEFAPVFVTDVEYFQYGIVMDAWIDGAAWAYFFDDNTGVELPHAIGGAYFEMLPDKNFLYQHDDIKRHGVEDDVAPGIYRYNAASGNLTVLVPGGCLYCSWPE